MEYNAPTRKNTQKPPRKRITLSWTARCNEGVRGWKAWDNAIHATACEMAGIVNDFGSSVAHRRFVTGRARAKHSVPTRVIPRHEGSCFGHFETLRTGVSELKKNLKFSYFFLAKGKQKGLVERFARITASRFVRTKRAPTAYQFDFVAQR